jgi:hypothetical protein
MMENKEAFDKDHDEKKPILDPEFISKSVLMSLPKDGIFIGKKFGMRILTYLWSIPKI